MQQSEKINIKQFFTEQERKTITQSIALAEENTSGEIRVHLEQACAEDVFAHAVKVFYKLKMHRTKNRNAVLIYIALDNRAFAVVGDEAIHMKVTQVFWDELNDMLRQAFQKHEYAAGMCAVIRKIGEKLNVFFPDKPGNANEISNDISFGAQP